MLVPNSTNLSAVVNHISSKDWSTQVRSTCMKSGKVIRVVLYVFILGQGPLRSGQNPAHQAAKGRRVYDVIMM